MGFIFALCAILAPAACTSVVGTFQRIEPKALDITYLYYSSLDFMAAVEASGKSEKITNGRVTVFTQPETRKLAGEIAGAADRSNRAAAEGTGIPWIYSSELYLLAVPQIPAQIEFNARKEKGIMAVGVFATPSDQTPADVARSNPFFPQVWAHEMTESAMVLAGKGRTVFVNDPCLGGLGWTMGTRWFREGVSNCAAYFVLREMAGPDAPPDGELSRPFSSLGLVRDKLFKWNQCHGPKGFDGLNAGDLYAAAFGLLLELRERNGADAVARLTASFGPSATVDGDAILSAMRRLFAFDAREFARDYRYPFLGVELVPEWPKGERMKVKTVIEGTPAAKGGIKPGDVFEGINGRPVYNAWKMEWALRDAPVGREMALDVRREGKIVRLTITPCEFTLAISRPAGRQTPPPMRSGIAASVRPVY